MMDTTFVGSDGRRHASRSQAAMWCILTAAGVDFTEEYELPDGRRADFVVRHGGKITHVIESKCYEGDIGAAIKQVREYRWLIEPSAEAVIVMGPERFTGMNARIAVDHACYRVNVLVSRGGGTFAVSPTRINGGGWNEVMAEAKNMLHRLSRPVAIEVPAMTGAGAESHDAAPTPQKEKRQARHRVQTPEQIRAAILRAIESRGGELIGSVKLRSAAGAGYHEVKRCVDFLESVGAIAVSRRMVGSRWQKVFSLPESIVHHAAPKSNHIESEKPTQPDTATQPTGAVSVHPRSILDQINAEIAELEEVARRMDQRDEMLRRIKERMA